MKKIGIIMMALALVMGMSQCKKNEQQANNSNNTLRVRFMTENNSKLYFDGETAFGRIPVLWNAQDIVYVASDGQIVGYIYGSGSVGEYCDFNGNQETIDLDAIQMGKHLQFFILGAQAHNDLHVGDTQYVFSYADQREDPAVVSYGISTDVYSGPEAFYQCWNFSNYNALVKFTVNRPTDDELTIQGVKNQMLIRFDGTSENDETEGAITTFMNRETNSNIRYAVVPANQKAVSGDVYVGGNKVGTFNIPQDASRDRFIKGTITLD